MPVVIQMIRTTTPMLLAAIACTANSGSRCSAYSASAHATMLSPMPATYRGRIVALNAARLPLVPVTGVDLAARSSRMALQP